MKESTILMMTLLSLMMTSCGQHIDGSSDDNFKKSRAKMEQSLNESEKENLEKAFRVIALIAIKEEWNSSDKNGSANEISLRIVNGKTYKQLVAVAEEFLKQDKEKNIEQVQKKIEELEIRKAKYLQQKSKLDILEAKPVKIDLVNGELVIYCEFTNHSKEYINHYGTVIGYSSNQNGQDGWSCNRTFGGVNELAPNESKIFTCEYDFDRAKEKSNIILWDKIKFPVTDFSQYNIVVECYTSLLIIEGVSYELDTSAFDEEAEQALQDYKAELKGYLEQEATLDQLELTEKTQ